MVELLTPKEMQTLLQVDRSTIYRMAEAKRLPAIKVGKQWRFPADAVEKWLQQQSPALVSAKTIPASIAPLPEGASNLMLPPPIIFN